MKKLLLLSALIAFNAVAMELNCEAWYQEKGKLIETQTMPLTATTASEKRFATFFKGYEYSVEWHFALTTLYTVVKKNNDDILFTTARIPTENHPEAFTDINLPGGPRLSVNCALK